MIDDLIATLQKPLSEISNVITTLEINGLIEKNIEGKYQMRSI
jgi:DNA-binding IclR family transcriptional regulator